MVAAGGVTDVITYNTLAKARERGPWLRGLSRLVFGPLFFFFFALFGFIKDPLYKYFSEGLKASYPTFHPQPRGLEAEQNPL